MKWHKHGTIVSEEDEYKPKDIGDDCPDYPGRAGGIQWVTTGVHRKYGEPRGWKLHAVKAQPEETFKGIAGRRSACGHVAPWGMDLHIEKKCAVCLRATGLACRTCRGRGHVGKALDQTLEHCWKCHGTGEREVPVMVNDEAEKKVDAVLGTPGVTVRAFRGDQPDWVIEIHGNGRSLDEIIDELTAMKAARVRELRGE